MEILELKNEVTEMIHQIGSVSTMEMTKKKVNELEDRLTEIIQFEQQNKK